MVAKLATTPKKRQADARADCIRFARAIIAVWPRDRIGHWESHIRRQQCHDEFATNLLVLPRSRLHCPFLAKLAEMDEVLQLDALILAACREFGWTAFARELQMLIAGTRGDAPSAGNPAPRSRMARRVLLRPNRRPGEDGVGRRIVRDRG